MPEQRRSRTAVVALAAALAMAGCSAGQQAAAPEASPVASEASPAVSAPASTPAASTVASPSGTPSASTAAKTCSALAGELDTAEKIGQLFMVGTTSGESTSLEGLVREHKVGSVILLGSDPRPLAKTASLSHELSGFSTREDIPVLVATDQEGGEVQRLQGEGFSDIPPAVEQGRLTNAELSAQWARWGQELKAAGVLYALAPVADVPTAGKEQGNAAIGALGRHYATDPATVANKTTAVVKGLQKAEIASSLKHYPGLGRAAVNTDHGVATDAVTTLADAKPFLAPMKAGASSVMISSTIYSRIDPGVPAVFSSKLITDGLRSTHGWDKVVISDDLGAAAAVADVPVAERGVRFIAAGGDLVIDADPASLAEMVGGVTERAEQDPKFEAALGTHAARVLALKSEVGLVDCTP
ncbi:glycoside hydrolase family 3 protein [Luteococcus sediminum]|uniref:glycoside hydrolase family 3 N-terminal domain-containing protein n=1 Tax=Luteococcus sp. TaxID=1969402 RepID=UPI0037366C8F